MTVVLCDADGCLFPSEEPAFEASAETTNRMLAALGARSGFTGEELRAASTGRNFRSSAPLLAAAEGYELSPAELERWVADELQTVTAHLAARLRPDAAVIEPLTRLASGHPLAVVTSSASSRLDACLRATGLAALFAPASRFSAEDSLERPTSKPDPAVYLHALERLGLDGDEALAVEDSVAGAEAALAAGLCTLGNVMFVPAGERSDRIADLTDAGVDGIVSSWAEVCDLLAAGDLLLEAGR